MSIFGPIGLPGTEPNSLNGRCMTSIRSKFQSCPNELKLNIQDLLTQLITKMSHLSILNQNCGSLCSNRALIFAWCNGYARFMHKFPQLWVKIDESDVFVIRRVRSFCIFNFSSFGQLSNFDLIEVIRRPLRVLCFVPGRPIGLKIDI